MYSHFAHCFQLIIRSKKVTIHSRFVNTKLFQIPERVLNNAVKFCFWIQKNDKINNFKVSSILNYIYNLRISMAKQTPLCVWSTEITHTNTLEHGSDSHDPQREFDCCIGIFPNLLYLTAIAIQIFIHVSLKQNLNRVCLMLSRSLDTVPDCCLRSKMQNIQQARSHQLYLSVDQISSRQKQKRYPTVMPLKTLPHLTVHTSFQTMWENVLIFMTIIRKQI